MTKVFISYSRKDLDFVEKLVSDLKDAGLDVWYDLSGLEGGILWRVAIEEAIQSSQYIIVVLSPDSVISEWVEEEVLLAKKLKRKIIPLIFRKCELPLGYHARQVINIRGRKYKENFSKILEALKIRPASQSRPGNTTSKKKRKPIKTEYAVAFIGAIATIIAGLLSSPLIEIWVNTTPETTKVLASPTITLTHPASSTETLIPSATPTKVSTFTPTIPPTKTSTPTPLPEEISYIDPTGNTIFMKLVPSGEFIMGSKEGDADESPLHKIYLDSYYIDKYEVTNALYKACVEMSTCQEPTDTTYYSRQSGAQKPVVFISWEMAQTYCKWRGSRLPTEAEWEKAARGTDGRIYPWGSEDSCAKANYDSCYLNGEIREVGYWQYSSSPYGIYDMAGNVWEWASDWYLEDYYQKTPTDNPLGPTSGSSHVIRGGSWESSGNDVRTSERGGRTGTNYKIGFRCAKDAP